MRVSIATQLNSIELSCVAINRPLRYETFIDGSGYGIMVLNSACGSTMQRGAVVGDDR